MNLSTLSGLGDFFWWGGGLIFCNFFSFFFFLPMLNLVSQISSLEKVNLIVPEKKSLSLGDILVEYFITYRGKFIELIEGRKIIYPFLFWHLVEVLKSVFMNC